MSDDRSLDLLFGSRTQFARHVPGASMSDSPLGNVRLMRSSVMRPAECMLGAVRANLMLTITSLSVDGIIAEVDRRHPQI